MLFCRFTLKAYALSVMNTQKPLPIYFFMSTLLILSGRNLNFGFSVVSRAFMAGAASQTGDADSSRAPGLTSGLQGSVNVHRGALLLVPQ